MEIKENGFTVTGLPRIEEISVKSRDEGVRIDFAGWTYTLDEWREFTEACVYVRDRLANAGTPAPTAAPTPYTWNRIEDVPDGIDIVYDREADDWRRGQGRWEGEPPEYVNKFAPFSLRRP